MARRVLVRYGGAAGLVAGTVLVGLLLSRWGELKFPLPMFYPAVVVSARLGGLGPGALATALGSLACAYLWIPPGYSLQIGAPRDLLALAVFVLVGLVTSAVCEVAIRARDRLEARSAAVRERARERRRGEN